MHGNTTICKLPFSASQKQVLKSYNYIVWPLKLFVLTLKLFVLTLKRRMGGVKLLVTMTKQLVVVKITVVPVTNKGFQ